MRRLTLEGESITCLVGPAGAGKSRTMGAAAEAWADRGIAVRGLAVSAAAAGVLETEAGIPCETIAKFLFDHDRPGGAEGRWRLGRNEVVVIDEAAMASSLDLARVVALATEAEAKVVLVGDHRQLGAVEAGGLFRLLALRPTPPSCPGCGGSMPCGNERPACDCATATGRWSRSTASTDGWWAATATSWSRKPSFAGNWPGPEAIRWWSALLTTPPWTNWHLGPERQE